MNNSDNLLIILTETDLSLKIKKNIFTYFAKLDSFFVNQHVYVVSTIKSGPVKAIHVTRP